MAIYDGVLNVAAEAALVPSQELRSYRRPAPAGCAIDATNPADVGLDAFKRVSSMSFDEQALRRVTAVAIAEDDSKYW